MCSPGDLTSKPRLSHPQMRASALALLLVFIVTATAAGQARAGSAFAALSPPALPGAVAPAGADTSRISEDSFPRGSVASRASYRSLAAAGGWLLGGLAGGIVGAGITGDQSGDDDIGGFTIAGGIFVGGTLGGALGAGLPSLGERCSYSRRAGQGLLGSLAGDVIGIWIANKVDERVGVAMLPALSSLGAGIMAKCG